MAFRKFKEESRKEWGQAIPDNDNISNELIQLGAILRIADATEKMCADRVKLEKDLEWFKKECRQLNEEIAKLRRSKASYIGKLRKAKSEIEKLKGDRTWIG